MEDTRDQILTMKLPVEAIDAYAKYWKEHVAPIKEESTQAQFTTILVDVFGRLYGNWAAVDLAFRLLAVDRQLKG